MNHELTLEKQIATILSDTKQNFRFHIFFFFFGLMNNIFDLTKYNLRKDKKKKQRK